MATGRLGAAVAVVAAVVTIVLATPFAAAAPGSPSCSKVATVEGDVGSYLRVQTCSAFFASAKRYRPARYKLVSGSLPPGLELWGDGEPAAQIDGTPRKVGVWRFTVAATDVLGGRATGTYTVQIHPRLVLPGGSLGRATAGAPYWNRISASGGKPPYTYGSFPLGGLALDRSTGVVSGTLTGGPHVNCGPVRLTVTDATGARASGEYALELLDAAGRHHDANCDVVDGVRALTWVQGVTPRRGPIPVPGPKKSLLEIAPVTIRGRGLRNVTRVSFAGTRAVFDVDSDTRITAIPPFGAHTGEILLRTVDGRIRSAGIYRVFFGG